MADVYGGPFGGYADVTEVITANGQAAVIVEVNKLRALIQDPDVLAGNEHNVSSASPDFDRIHPALARQFLVEIDALIAAIDAAPTS